MSTKTADTRTLIKLEDINFELIVEHSISYQERVNVTLSDLMVDLDEDADEETVEKHVKEWIRQFKMHGDWGCVADAVVVHSELDRMAFNDDNIAEIVHAQLVHRRPLPTHTADGRPILRPIPGQVDIFGNVVES